MVVLEAGCRGKGSFPSFKQLHVLDWTFEQTSLGKDE